MTARIQVVCGPARSGKTHTLLERYRSVLTDRRPPGTVLWLAPTWRTALHVRQQLIGGRLRACLAPGVTTFSRFGDSVVAAGQVPARPISPIAQRFIIRRLLARARNEGRLQHFGPIAGTPGLVDLVAELIAELKRVDVWPDEFAEACQARGLRGKDRELIDVYRGYQDFLNDNGLYDAEGRLWLARELLRQGQSQPYADIEIVVVDGFSDLTRTQQEILELLAARVQELHIGLLLERDDDRGRQDLWAKTRTTFDQLRSRFPGVEVCWKSRRSGGVPQTLDQLEANLFGDPRNLVAPTASAHVEVVGAAHQRGEIETVARRIKQLLADGDRAHGGRPVPAGDVAVVFRTLTDVVPLVRETFARLGVPVAIDSADPLSRCPMLRALVNLFRVDTEDWPFRRLLAALSSGYFRPDWPEFASGEAAHAAEAVIRHFQIPSGRRELIARCRSLAEAPPPAADALDAEPTSWQRKRASLIDKARLALGLLERLAGAFDKLPHRATLAEWLDAIAQLADETGLSNAFSQAADHGALPTDQAPPAPADAAAWERMCGCLSELATASDGFADRPEPIDRSGLVDVLQEVIRHEVVLPEVDETGRVRVLTVSSARNLTVRYLFVAGLSEKAFPLSMRDDRLYSEAETQRLREQNLPLVMRQQHLEEEMLLFYEVVTRAEQFLCFSYPALDERAQELLPSPYLSDALRACGLARDAELNPPDLRPIPAGDPFDAASWRLRAVADALDGDCRLLAGLASAPGGASVGRNILNAIDQISARARADGFGAFEGMLEGDATRSRISTAFGPQHCFSADSLEQYQHCPYQFFAERLLRLEPLEDLALEVDYGRRGAALHESLAAFHRRLNEQLGHPASPLLLDEATYQQQIAQSIEEVLNADRALDAMSAGMLEIDRRLLVTWALEYRAQHAAYDAQWDRHEQPPVPSHFEVSFGTNPSSVDPLSTPEPLELMCEEQPVRVMGRIDRIDLGTLEERQTFNIVDYKSGRHVPSTSDIVGLKNLQLVLYTIAAEDLLFARQQVQAWQFGYWHIRDKGFTSVVELGTTGDTGPTPRPEWLSLREAALHIVAGLVRGIRSGQFPVASRDANCTSYCAFKTICRINQVRALEKQWNPPPRA